MNFEFNYNKKRNIIDVRICDNYFSKASGLMFRKNSKPLLFIFKKKNNSSIHSFFCIPFIGIWFDGDKIVDIKYVRPWRINVSSKNKFDKLLEIPRNNSNFDKFKLLQKIKSI